MTMRCLLRPLLVILFAAVAVPALFLQAATAAGKQNPEQALFLHQDSGPAAFSTMAPLLQGLAREQGEGEWFRQFARGRTVFNRPWLAAGAEDNAFDGLGPLFNRLSCVACHPRNGSGFAPETEQERMRTMLVRLSVPGQDAHGGPKPHPLYGDQLNEEAVPPLTGEGEARIRWTPRTVSLNGETVTLRQPSLLLSLAGEPEPPAGLLLSPRIAPPVFGLALLEAVPEADLLARAATPPAEGLHGQLNQVWDEQLQRLRPGRFGWKANQPTLRQQSLGAMSGDIGITSSLLPHGNCGEGQAACRAMPDGGTPELSDSDAAALVFYLQGLAVPARRNVEDEAVRRGEALFATTGCAGCHQESMTSNGPVLAAMLKEQGVVLPLPLADQQIHPYTDLLLHDMGDDLADGRPDFAASGSQWRTPPLWGLGLRTVASPRSGLLHDGRARTPQEAILWHGGEALPASQAYRALSPAQRSDLLRFLDSL